MENKKKKKMKKQIRNFVAKTSQMRKFQFIGIAIAILTLLLMFVSFGYIFNTKMNNNQGGTEVSFNGYNLLFAAFSGSYTSADKGLYGDIAVPFTYYAKDWISSLGVLIMFPFFLTIGSIGIELYALIKNKQQFSLINAIITFLSFLFFLAIFIVGLSMKDSKILPIYCSGNPACSIHSLAILPAISILLGTIVSIINFIQYIKAKKDLKD